MSREATILGRLLSKAKQYNTLLDLKELAVPIEAIQLELEKLEAQDE